MGLYSLTTHGSGPCISMMVMMTTMKYPYSVPNLTIVLTMWFLALCWVKKTTKMTSTPMISTSILTVSIPYNNIYSLLNIISYSVS